MVKNQFKLTLDIQATYQIKVPGEITCLQSSIKDLSIEIKEDDPTGFVVTIFTCRLDQAGLYGFLKKIYSMGLPLLSVRCIECGQ